ncbi:O-antigen ligase family protein [Dinoroseobacter sp. S76]|uniref:O-antigen ligase family protein n=1 Tax=Dinoroseobacter sp. S76 TaxID=3415124 RepID=UPI003C7B8540
MSNASINPATPQANTVSGLAMGAIIVFLLSYLIPGTITLGTITMGFPRLVLTLAFIPSVSLLLFSPRYKLTWVDGMVICYAFWVFLSVLINNGLPRLQFAGLQVVETLGAYALGRIILSQPEAYRFFWRFFAYCLLFITPIALIELTTERFILFELLGPFIDIHGNATIGYPARLGFDRVQGNLEHPILFGVFWGFGMMHFLSVFDSRQAQFFFASCCILVVFTSLSSGAYLALMIQLALLSWGVMSRNRWKLLILLFVISFLIVEVLSDRPAIIAISTRLAFSAGTAYWRVLIFEYGMMNVWDNPIFGLGLRDWVRPSYMGSSVDNQWLLTAMRGGFPAFFLQMGAFAMMIFMLVRRKDLSPVLQKYRRNYLIGFVGLFVALGTVAVWSGTQAFLWILLAMGTNFAVAPSAATEESPQSELADGQGSPQRRGASYTRQNTLHPPATVYRRPHDAPSRAARHALKRDGPFPTRLRSPT